MLLKYFSKNEGFPVNCNNLGGSFAMQVVSFLLINISLFDMQAQGTILFLNFGHGMQAPVYDARTGAPLDGQDWRAQLYYSPNLLAPDSALTRADSPPITGFRQGYFDENSNNLLITLQDVPINKGFTAQIRVWNAVAGSTYEEAASSPLGVVGKSNAGLASTGDPEGAPGRLWTFYKFSVSPVPEPSVLALLTMATVLLLFAALRKGKKGLAIKAHCGYASVAPEYRKGRL